MNQCVLLKVDMSTYNDIIKLFQQREEHRRRCRERYRAMKANNHTPNVEHNNTIFEVVGLYNYQQPTLEIINDTSQQYQHTNSQQTNVFMNVGVSQAISN